MPKNHKRSYRNKENFLFWSNRREVLGRLIVIVSSIIAPLVVFLAVSGWVEVFDLDHNLSPETITYNPYFWAGLSAFLVSCFAFPIAFFIAKIHNAQKLKFFSKIVLWAGTFFYVSLEIISIVFTIHTTNNSSSIAMFIVPFLAAMFIFGILFLLHEIVVLKIQSHNDFPVNFNQENSIKPNDSKKPVKKNNNRK